MSTASVVVLGYQNTMIFENSVVPRVQNTSPRVVFQSLLWEIRAFDPARARDFESVYNTISERTNDKAMLNDLIGEMITQINLYGPNESELDISVDFGYIPKTDSIGWTFSPKQK